MTTLEIIEFAEGLIDDTFDQDVALSLLNVAKDKIEGERDWEFLKKTATGSATTAAISAPADFRYTLSMYVGTQPYRQIPFEQKQLFQSSANCWYFDAGNSNLYLIGITSGQTYYHYYIKTTDELTASVNPTWWPTRFHRLLGFELAEMYYAIDQGERGRSWDDKMALQKELLRRSMVDWDANLKRRANENAVAPDFDPPIDIGLM